MFSYGPIYMDEQVLDNQLEVISSVRTKDVAWKTSWERWTMETLGKTASRKSVLVAWYDDDDDDVDDDEFVWVCVCVCVCARAQYHQLLNAPVIFTYF